MSGPLVQEPHPSHQGSATQDRGQNLLPMYDLLVSQLNEKMATQPFTLDHDYIVRLSTVLNALETDQAEQVALLLIHHYFLSNPGAPSPFVPKTTSRGSSSRLPYEIKMSTGRGFSFDPASTPALFQALLGILCGL
uniref:Uncharacterized protein n=1 Tax=viral metagenome TaxID=1070528 RepID=A0A6C0IX94_9ZZZZ